MDAATIRVLRRLVRGDEHPRAAVEALGIQFFEAESPEEDRLVEALWAASAGEHLDEGSLAVARALVR